MARDRAPARHVNGVVRRRYVLSGITMNSIPLTDADGSEGLPICRAQREWLVSRYKSEPMIALKFFSADVPVAEPDASTDAKAIHHVRKCPKCRDWLHHVVPATVLRRRAVSAATAVEVCSSP